MTTMRISFPKQGFFVGNAEVALSLDGTTVYQGSFRDGFDVTISAEPGEHSVEAEIRLSLGRRRRAWRIVVPPAGCDVAVKYSRL